MGRKKAVKPVGPEAPKLGPEETDLPELPLQETKAEEEKPEKLEKPEKPEKPKKPVNVHADHRKRVQKEYEELGIESFSDVRALEYLLFYAIPRRDTNELAHALLAHFGSLYNVLAASREELMLVDGIGPQAASLLSLVCGINRKAKADKERDDARRLTFDNSSDAGRLICSQFQNERNESFRLFFLDSNKKLLGMETVATGVVNCVSIDLRRCAELALFAKASSVIAAHNHPDGDLSPSPEDKRLTQRLASAMNTLGIPLVDHFIVSGDWYYSFADHGLL